LNERLVMIGNAAGGKSTLARALADRRSHLYHLDRNQRPHQT
jgi:adenylate kinase family enzyme